MLLAVGHTLAGCGSSGTPATTVASASATRTGPPPGPPPGATRFGPSGPPGTAAGPQPTHGIGALVLRRGVLPGFQAQGGVGTATTAAAFAAVEGVPPERIKNEAARLARAGFVAGAIEHLMSAAGPEGLSVADRFRSSKSANAEVVFTATAPRGVRQIDFTVPGIPGGRGFAASNGQSSGQNIAFAVGMYYHLVGIGWQTGLPNPPPRALLVASAGRLYKRVHG